LYAWQQAIELVLLNVNSSFAALLYYNNKVKRAFELIEAEFFFEILNVIREDIFISINEKTTPHKTKANECPKDNISLQGHFVTGYPIATFFPTAAPCPGNHDNYRYF